MNDTNAKRLFWASFLTLIAAGIGFSVRGAILGAWSTKFGFTATELGTITGGGLAGFGLTIIFLSFFADRIGYGPLMILAFLLHLSSALVTLAATPIFNATSPSKGPTYWCLYIGMFLFALGNGTCEAVINPLTATLFPKQKTHWLNILHAGWPGGLILGALIGLGFNYASKVPAIGAIPWEVQMSIFLLPTLAYGGLLIGCTFPRSEASLSGVTMKQMMQELGLAGATVATLLIWLWMSTTVFSGFGLSSPLAYGLATPVAVGLLILFGYFSEFRFGHWMLAMLLVLHALVGYVELGTDSWITNITGRILAEPNYGLMLFIWTSGLMFVLRFFAGPIVHKISPLGLLCASACLGCTGLLLLGRASYFNAYGALAAAAFCVFAATVYGFGKTFLWPTMLGVVSERFPRGGALTMGMMGGVGMLSAGLLGGPGIGYKQDYFASQKLQQLDSAAYARYKSADANSFLFFPTISGLDGSKVATLNDKGKQLETDKTVLEKSGRKLEDDKNLKQLSDWWDTEGKPHADDDSKPVTESGLYGGEMALTYTAAVPATMALGFLLLILYFRMIGGYKAIHLTEEPKLPDAGGYAPGFKQANGEGYTDGIPGEGVESTPL